MTLEALLCRRVAGDPELAARLARFDGRPAVFQGSAPDGADPGWEGGRAYPQAVCAARPGPGPQRRSAGTAEVNLRCGEGGVGLRELEPILRRALQGALLRPDGCSRLGLDWAGTEVAEGDARVRFSLYEFPERETCDPDPVAALWTWTKRRVPSAAVLGRDNLGDDFQPTLEWPAFYFRVEQLETAEKTNTVAWVQGVVAGHVFAPTAGNRARWLRALSDELAMDGELTLPDGSPMRLTKVRADCEANELSDGQLRLSVRFGLLRRPGYAHPLNHARVGTGTGADVNTQSPRPSQPL